MSASGIVEVDAPSWYEDQVAHHHVYQEARRLGVPELQVKWFSSGGATRGLPIQDVFPEAVKSAAFVPVDRLVLYLRVGQPVEQTIKNIRLAMSAWTQTNSHLKSLPTRRHVRRDFRRESYLK